MRPHRAAALRAATAAQVLTNFGEVFTSGHDAARSHMETFEAQNVDLFISHSWGAEGYQKYLALCYHLNVNIAIKVAFLTFAIFGLVLVLLAGGPDALSGSPALLPLTVDLPVVVFFIFFFYGHVLACGRCSPSLWLDKICIPQADEVVKEECVRRLPEYLKASSQMLVLWDRTYFERMWCNLKKHTDRQAVVMLPLWLAPWLLLIILIDWMSIRIFSLWWMVDSSGIPSVDGSYQSYFMRNIVYHFYNSLAYMPAGLVAALVFRRNLQLHRAMLSQLADFEVRSAKLSMERDRPMLEAQITALYDEIEDAPIHVAFGVEADSHVAEALLPVNDLRSPSVRVITSYPSPEKCLDLFNADVSGTLLREVQMRSGDRNLPLKVCMLSFMPFFFYDTSSCFFACENTGSCKNSLKFEGFSNMSELYIADTVLMLTYALCMSTLYPCLLRIIPLLGSHVTGLMGEALVDCMSGCLAYLHAFMMAATVHGCFVGMLSKGPSPLWLVLFSIAFAWMIFLWFTCFFKRSAFAWISVSGSRCFGNLSSAA